MKLFKIFRNKDRKIIFRLKKIIFFAINLGKISLIDVPDIIDNKVKVTKILGNSLLDSGNYNWIISHWMTALSICYKSKNFSKDQLKIILKSEQDLINILYKYKDLNQLNHFQNILVKYEKYEIAAQIRDILKKIKL